MNLIAFLLLVGCAAKLGQTEQSSHFYNGDPPDGVCEDFAYSLVAALNRERQRSLPDQVVIPIKLDRSISVEAQRDLRREPVLNAEQYFPSKQYAVLFFSFSYDLNKWDTLKYEHLYNIKRPFLDNERINAQTYGEVETVGVGCGMDRGHNNLFGALAYYKVHKSRTMDCPWDYSGLFPDISHCSRYYACWQGFRAIAACPRGQLFDEDTKKCVNPSAAACPPNSDPTPSPQETLRCLYDPVAHFPDPQNCELYYGCVDGDNALSVQCPQNLKFDYITGQCLDSSIAHCFPGSDRRPTPQPNQCPPNYSGPIPNRLDCQTYDMCLNGKFEYHARCDDGYLFDSVSYRCVVSYMAQCLGPNPNPPVPQPLQCPPNYSGLLPNPYVCKDYYFCMNGQLGFESSCCAGNLFDSVELRCVEQYRARCFHPKPPAPQPCPPNYSGLRPNPDNCRDYFFCMYGVVQFEASCCAGYFDAVQLRCVEQFNPNCLHGQKVKPCNANRQIGQDLPIEHDVHGYS